MTFNFLLIAVLAAPLGLALLISGLIGKRSGTEPRCTKCKFELSGLPKPHQTCPECGTQLTTPRAVRTGIHRRGKKRIIAAIPLLLIATTVGGAFFWVRATNFNINTIKPTAWLITDAKTTGTAAHPALDELIRRANAGKISATVHTQIINTGLTHQANLATTWEPKWGELLMHAFTSGAMTQPQETLFLRHAFSYSTNTRARIRQGDRVLLQFSHIIRAGPANVFLSQRIAPLSLECEGQTISSGSSVSGSHSLRTFTTGQGSNDLSLCRVADTNDNSTLKLAPGTHQITAAIALSTAITNTSNNVQFPAHNLPPDWQHADSESPVSTDTTLPHAVTWIHRETFTIEVLPPDANPITLNHDPSVADQLRNALELWEIRRSTRDDQISINVSFEATGDPISVPITAEVFARTPDQREWFLGTLSLRPNPAPNPTYTWTTGAYESNEQPHDKPKDHTGPVHPLMDFNAAQATIILRPSISTAIATTDIEEICGTELIFKDIPVRDIQPAPLPD